MMRNFKITLLLCLLCLACGREAQKSKPVLPRKAEQVCKKLVDAGYQKSAQGSAYILLKWKNGPAVTPSENKLELIFASAADCLENAKNTFEITKIAPFMSVHGHGAPTDDLHIETIDNGFAVSGLYFVMSGPWELNVEFSNLGVADRIEFKVTVP